MRRKVIITHRGIVIIVFVALLLMSFLYNVEFIESIKITILLIVSIVMITMHNIFMNGTATLKHWLIWTLILVLNIFFDGWLRGLI